MKTHRTLKIWAMIAVMTALFVLWEYEYEKPTVFGTEAVTVIER